MGYRSDVVIAFAFDTKEQIEEVLAIYRMHTFVQQHDLEKLWSVHDWGDCWGLTYSADYVKWYETYEDVQGIEHMLKVVQNFVDARTDVGETYEDGKQEIVQSFHYAYRMFRIGEDDNDIQYDHNGNDGNLEEALYHRMNLRREIVTDF